MTVANGLQAHFFRGPGGAGGGGRGFHLPAEETKPRRRGRTDIEPEVAEAEPEVAECQLEVAEADRRGPRSRLIDDLGFAPENIIFLEDPTKEEIVAALNKATKRQKNYARARCGAARSSCSPPTRMAPTWRSWKGGSKRMVGVSDERELAVDRRLRESSWRRSNCGSLIAATRATCDERRAASQGRNKISRSITPACRGARPRQYTTRRRSRRAGTACTPSAARGARPRNLNGVGMSCVTADLFSRVSRKVFIVAQRMGGSMTTQAARLLLTTRLAHFYACGVRRTGSCPARARSRRALEDALSE